MGYDQQTITKTVEKYIQEVQLHRDAATVTVFEAEGILSAEDDLNDAGQRYHFPERNVQWTFTVEDMVAAGLNPADVIAIDEQIRAMAETMVAWKKAQNQPS